MLKNKSLLLGVTGGVASYKSVELVRRLIDEGMSVSVIITEAAQKFVTPLSLEIASRNTVYTDLFSHPMAHITLPSQADFMVIAPATANLIGKFAHGLADDLLSTCLLAFRGKVLIAPSMNWRMYTNVVVQENLASLLSRGVVQVGPEEGKLACGEEGPGRMSEVPDIVAAVKSALAKKDLANERILVTAGPTREYIDHVRFISNRSSGKMGYAVARAALRRGADVTLISGNTSLHRPQGVTFIPVETAEDMLRTVREKIPSSTVLVMTAAVADFMPREKSPWKIEKKDGLLLNLVRTPDILMEISREKNRPFLVGFAAETGEKVGNAKKKLKEKKLDLIVFNDVTEPGAGFDVDTNKVILIDAKEQKKLPLLSKDEVADAILDRITEIKA
ncbi:MAG: bifunctional phosphopantothenoylcysteine decarboxylase/phosphopantothenate--cysteine ligase CoaBC [Thermodesulfovibrionales bacterium]|nr:bifunctional phosphopantothenoylcysteine decarboxylase/phosphopantothenate--cysteine ligase CoaBC [Thermodesulfovibrionales bacterium]